VKGSVFSGLAVAKQLNSLELLASVRNAFVAGIDDAVRVAAVVAAAGVILALAFMPGRVHATDTAETSQAQPGGVTVSQDEW
jgi:hypothetical protein